MKNYLILPLITFFALLNPTLGTTFYVEDPCSGNYLTKIRLESEFENLGKATIFALDESGLEYVGNEIGIHKIGDTPVGDDALEIINRLEMRSYGWCYSVDGKIPEILPPAFELTGKEKNITWFFGYAYYRSGQWLSQCEKVSSLRPAFICSK